MAQKYLKIIKKLGPLGLKLNEPLAKHTTFKIGGRADLFFKAKNEEEIILAINLARKEKIPYFILGGGSNLLVADGGFKGIVIKIGNSKFKILGCKVLAEAGTKLGKLVEETARRGLSGLEFAAGIPGTMGGAVRGNAGAWQEAIGDRVWRVKVLTEEGKIKWLERKKCQFSYRWSRFKKTKEVILEVELRLKKGDQKEIERKIKENLLKRASQPKEPSAGCIFINPKTELVHFEGILKSFSAGELIDNCGLKGRRIGDAQISPKHANFIVNLGKAKATDVIRLIKLAKEKVKKKFGIELKEEICFLGFAKFSSKS